MHLSITAPAMHVSLITLSSISYSSFSPIVNTLMDLQSGLAPDCFLLYIYVVLFFNILQITERLSADLYDL